MDGRVVERMAFVEKEGIERGMGPAINTIITMISVLLSLPLL